MRGSIGYLGWRMIRFLQNDNSGSDLFAIFTLSYLVSIKDMGVNMSMGIAIAAYLLLQTIYLDHRERRMYSF